MSTSRETARDKLETLLEAALVGTGLPCKTVTASKVDDLKGLTPLVAILGVGSLRERLTFQGDIPTFFFTVQVWVRQATTGWTNAQAEDALDNIESIIAQVYETNRRESEFELLEYTAQTTVMELTVAGDKYFVELIPTAAKLAKS